jgi:hypothetical protein
MLLGLGLLGLWWAWVFMLAIGVLFHLDVVNVTISLPEALPLGYGFTIIGFVPLYSLLLAATGETPKGPTPE